MKNNRKVFGCVGYTALVFASMEPVSKLLNGQVNPFTLTFWRFLIGSAFVFPMAVREIRRKGFLCGQGISPFWQWKGF